MMKILGIIVAYISFGLCFRLLAESGLFTNILLYSNQPPENIKLMINELADADPPIIGGSNWYCLDFVRLVVMSAGADRFDIPQKLAGMKKSGFVRIRPDRTDEFTQYISPFESDSKLEWICRMCTKFDIECGLRTDEAIVFGLIKDAEISKNIYYIKYQGKESGTNTFVVYQGDSETAKSLAQLPPSSASNTVTPTTTSATARVRHAAQTP